VPFSCYRCKTWNRGQRRKDKELKQLADALFGSGSSDYPQLQKTDLSRFVEAQTGLAREFGQWTLSFIK
jgi:hypothetical protein